MTIKTTSLTDQRLNLDYVHPDPTIGDFGWAQREYVAEIERQYNRGQPVRIITLKARQLGISTVTEAVLFLWAFLHPGTNGAVIAHTDGQAQQLFEKTKKYWETWPHRILFTEKYKTRRQLQWIETESNLRVVTAKLANGLRGSTMHALHMCVHEDQTVVLADGSSKKIKDVDLGDRVFTSSGAVAPVSAKIMTGVKPTLRLTTWLSNEPIRASADHKILTLYKQKGTLKYKRLGDITSKDWIARPKYQFEHADKWEFSLPLRTRPQHGGTARKDNETFALDHDFGYLAGYYLAEGHISKNRRRIQFACHASETFYKRLERFFAHPPRMTFFANKTVLEFNDVFMAHALDELCGRVADKHVPTFGNPDFFAGLLEGYLDGDGSKTVATGITATSVHERIARNINRIGEMLEWKGSLHYHTGRNRYGVPSKPQWVNSFSYGDSRPWIRKYRFVDGQCFVRVKSVVPDEVAPTYELEIDHPDHNYETPSGVIANSEVAFWEDAESLWGGLEPSVPNRHGTFVCIESTANGVGNWFYDEWQAAEAGDSTFHPMFFPWYRHPAARVYGTTLHRVELDAEEKELLRMMRAAHLLDEDALAGLAYRRMTIRTKGEDWFNQEMPATPEVAFLTSGNPIFNPAAVRDCYEPKTGVRGRMFRNSRGDVIFEQDSSGYWTLFKQPHPEPNPMRYFIGGDPARSDSVLSDPACIQVINRANLEQVAVYHGTTDPIQLGRQMILAGDFFGHGMLCPEVEGGGMATITVLLESGYGNVWNWKKGDRTNRASNTYGWSTNYNTKRQMIATMQDMLNDRVLTIHDKRTFNELLQYVQHEDGSIGNEGRSGHDDTVSALMIAITASYMEPLFDPREKPTRRLDLFGDDQHPTDPGDLIDHATDLWNAGLRL